MKKAFAAALLFFAFSVSYSQTFTLTDTSFKAGSIKRSYQISFLLGKDTLRPESYLHLDSVVTFLKNNPAITLEISVHADSRLSDKQNTNLTPARAKRICDYMVNNGIARNRLMPMGYGKTKLLIPDAQISKATTKQEQEQLHALNRRVEFKILSL